MLRFSKDHEWIRIDGDIATIGITVHAATQLGDLVFIELPEVGKELARSDNAAVVESVKAASDVYAPVSGTVTDINEAIIEDPSQVNADPENAGWFFKLKLKDKAETADLLDKDAYKALTE